MLKNKIKLLLLAGAAVLGMGVLSACQTGAGGGTAPETQAEIPAGTPVETPAESPAEEEARTLLQDMIKAVESQYPEQTFSELTDLDEKVSGLTYKDSYVFGGRTSSAGWQYIAAVCKTAENPLEGLSCGTAPAVPEFSASQFDGGRLMLFENSGGQDTELSFLYDALQKGEEGIYYLLGTTERGVRLIPPEEGAFLKVSLVKEGSALTEFIPVTEEEAETLKSGRPAEEYENFLGGGLMFCENREVLTAERNDPDTVLTQDMIRLAAEKSGFEPWKMADAGNLAKAVLSADFHGEVREETIENGTDLDLLEQILKGAGYAGYQPSGSYEGMLTLTSQDGLTFTAWLPGEGGGCVFGSSMLMNISEEDTQRVWEIFTTVNGFRKYGDRIHMKMTKPEFTAEEENLTFTLQNDTGKQIQYILSPIIYKKEGSQWKRIDSIAGFCGFVSDMEGEEQELSIPWKDAFELEGAGTYRVSISVMPEQEVRFDISDTFTVVSLR